MKTLCEIINIPGTVCIKNIAANHAKDLEVLMILLKYYQKYVKMNKRNSSANECKKVI